MQTIDTGTYGAKRQTFHSASPRAVLLDIVERYPRESNEKLFDIAFEMLSETPGCLRAVAEYWFANEMRNILRGQPKQMRHTTTVAQKTAELKEKLQQHIDRRVQIILSEMLMPSGVRLRDSERDECARAGGWFSMIADSLADGQRVGDVFDEEHLRRIYLAGQQVR